MKHEWHNAGGGNGWEVWHCRRCQRWSVPSALGGFLWPNVLRLVAPRWFGCR